ncbi:MAG: S41 family peptidase [Ramlibacter sp.]
MNEPTKRLAILLLTALLQACGGGGGDSAPTPAADACTIANQRQSLRDFMQEQYYWYRDMPAPDERAATMDAYFQSMLVRPVDRFSYSQPTEDYQQVFTEGRRVGYGYTLVWSDMARTQLRVRNVEPLSPAARAGLARGDRIHSIDGYTPADIAAGLLPAVTTPGVPRTFTVATAGGQWKMLTVTSEEYLLSPVAAAGVLEVPGPAGGAKVGYLAYNQFVTYSREQLWAAFLEFAQAGVSELILDLRYNGGGSVGVARELASLVGGAATASKLYAFLRFNDKQAGSTQRLLFEMPGATAGTPLGEGLRRVFVIAGGGTASASELVINGLQPFVDVVLIGEPTYGKPYGFVPFELCGTTYQAVQFESLNALGVGGFTSGFPPTCTVPDDLDHQLGDPAEARIRTALNYVATGSCGAAAALRAPKALPLETIGDPWPRGMLLD